MKIIANKYRLIKFIGSGGMGEVHLGEVIGSYGFKRKIAIKLLPQTMRKERFLRDAFINEAATLAGVSHPNLVKVFDFGETDDHLFLCMEYIHGFSLRELIRIAARWGESIPFEISLKIMTGIAEGLEYLHNKGVIHGDLSPRNIMMGVNGEVKILDFGLSRVLSNLSAQSFIGGKTGYLAPEVLREKKVIPPSDIFSFGIILGELLEEDLADELSEAEERPDQYGQLNDLLKECLCEDPEMRPQAETLLFTLKEGKRRVDSGYEVKDYLNQLPLEEEYTFADIDKSEKTSKKKVLTAAKLILYVTFATIFLVVSIEELQNRDTAKDKKSVLPTREDSVESAQSERRLASSEAKYLSDQAGNIHGDRVGPEVKKDRAKMSVVQGDGSPVNDSREFHVRSYPENAMVMLNDKHIGNTPIKIVPGDLERDKGNFLSLNLPGFKKHRVDISSREREIDNEIFIVLQREVGFLSVNVNPWAYVYVDGEELGTTPLINREIPVGAHTLLLVNEFLDVRISKEVEIKKGEREILIEDFFK